MQLHIRVQRRIGASARSWLSLCRDLVSGHRSAFTAHISLAYGSMGFSCFGHDPCLEDHGLFVVKSSPFQRHQFALELIHDQRDGMNDHTRQRHEGPHQRHQQHGPHRPIVESAARGARTLRNTRHRQLDVSVGATNCPQRLPYKI